MQEIWLLYWPNLTKELANRLPEKVALLWPKVRQMQGFRFIRINKRIVFVTFQISSFEKKAEICSLQLLDENPHRLFQSSQQFLLRMVHSPAHIGKHRELGERLALFRYRFSVVVVVLEAWGEFFIQPLSTHFHV